MKITNVRPLVLGTPAPELQDLASLGAQRVRICIQGHLQIAAAMRALLETMKALREGMRPKDVPGIASAELMKRGTRDAEYRRSIKDYLGGA